MSLYKNFASPLLDRLDSEKMHDLSRELLHGMERLPLVLRAGLVCCGVFQRMSDPRLRTSIAGVELDNPVMVGAGWDKKGRAVQALYELGFSGIEVGSVLQHAQPGNPRPRQFVIGPGVALNSLGFNSPGMEAVVENLRRYRDLPIPIGINIGKNKEVPKTEAAEAFAAVAKRLYAEATYFVINVSSPNTPGLRNLQDKAQLTAIVHAVVQALEQSGGRKPLFVKIAPELTFEAIDDVIQVVTDNRLSGIIATNTTNSVDIKAKYGKKWAELPGGVSGDDTDYRKLSTERVAHIHRNTKGQVCVIGVGGVKDGATALEKILAGASAVQVVTAIRGEGPNVAQRINREILKWMEQEKVRSLQEVVGKAA